MAFLVGLEKTKAAFEESPAYPGGFTVVNGAENLYNQGKEWFFNRSWETEEGSSHILTSAEIKTRYNIELDEEAAVFFQTRAPFNQHFSSVLACLAGGVADTDAVQFGLELLWPGEDKEQLSRVKRQRAASPDA